MARSSSAAPAAFLVVARFLTRASRVMCAIRSRMCTMPTRIVERLGDRPACANGRTARTGRITSPSVVSISTASMSARGTMTSSTRTSRKRRMLLSMARSAGEKAASSEALSASASAMSSRRLLPLRCRKKLVSRSNRLRSSRLRAWRAAAVPTYCRRYSGRRSTGSKPWNRPGLGAGSSRCVLVHRRLGACRIGVTHMGRGWQGRQGCAVRPLPCPRPRRRSRDHSRSDAGRHGQ